jgi:selenocysteine lyase/cysteine desulfurase
LAGEAAGNAGPGRNRLYQEQGEAEAAAARLLQTSPENIALLSNSSEALNLLANSIEWRPGDEVLVSDLEFPSNVITWLRLKHAGVRLVVVPTHGGIMRIEDPAYSSHACGFHQPGELQDRHPGSISR